ncbi:MAG TPA: 6-phosphogluconolactonase [Burkholderiales bacterium]|nr:6-phosphogluconolactonase [Burkholderiales bacterium]
MNSNSQIRRLHIYSSAEAMMQRLCQAIRRIAKEAITSRGCFHMVLSGGSTPRELYALLTDIEADWGNWHIWFGDERCLLPEDPERNSYMAAKIWLDKVAIPDLNRHIIPAEMGLRGARIYARLLSGMRQFDLTLLGLGEDGHTASLFPGHVWEQSNADNPVLFVESAPKPPSQRITLSARRLSESRQVIFLVSGLAKRKALASWLAGEHLPASAIIPVSGVDIAVSMDAWHTGA